MPARKPRPEPGAAADPVARVHAGDEAGAQDLGRRVAENLRARRRARGMSLDVLSRASGVSRAALSQIEARKTNPTVGLLWKIAVGLGVPFAELIGEPVGSVSVLRRGTGQVLRSTDGNLESRPLTPAGASPQVEIYDLRLAPGSRHDSEAHARGTREIVAVLSGTLTMHVGTDLHELHAGDSIGFPADLPHGYENPGAAEGRYLNVILYER